MSYHIKTPKKIGDGDVYYVNESHWSDNYDERKVFSTKSSATAVKNSTVTINDYTYTPKALSNSTIVNESV